MMMDNEVRVQEVNENDYVNVLEVAEDKVEECVCSRCGVSYFRVIGSNQAKKVCKKCFYENRTKTLSYTISNGVATFTTHKGITFTVDEEDCKRVAKYNWWVNASTGYVQGWVKGKLILLHRFILELNPTNKVLVDHINHDTRNNCKSNLRVCSHQENQRNRKDVKGYYKTPNEKYASRIAVDGKYINLGNYDTLEQANAVRIMAEKEYYGEFSPNVDLFDDIEIKRLYEEAIESIRLRHQNKARIEDDVVYITASSKEFVINIDDYEKIKDYKWCINNKGQIIGRIDGEIQMLARFLLGLTKGDRTKKVRFIDGDKLNFRRENLKVVECKTKNK